MSALPALDALTDFEQQIETALGTMQASWTTIAQCLLAIHDGGLYTPYGTWEAYCRTRWGHSRQWGYELVASAAVLNNVRCILHDGPLPHTIQQAKTLARLEPADQAAIWQEAVTRYGDPTGSQIAQAVQDAYVATGTGSGLHLALTTEGEDVYTPSPTGILEPAAVDRLRDDVLDNIAQTDAPPEEIADETIAMCASHLSDEERMEMKERFLPHVPTTPAPVTQKTPVNVEWYTPAKYIAAARAVLGTIDLDPASCAEANATVQATRYYTKEDDGLTQPWAGRIYCNPPYVQMERWVARLCASYASGAVPEALMLLNVSTGSRWFQPLWAYPICFVVGRIRFTPPAGLHADHGPEYDNAFIYFGPAVAAFAAHFRSFGPIVTEVGQ